MTVFLLDMVVASSADTPKSANLQSPSWLMRMFPDLMSLCIFLLPCKYSSPYKLIFMMIAICSSVNVRSQIAIKSQREPAPQNWQPATQHTQQQRHTNTTQQ